MKELTTKQQKTLDFIKTYIEEHICPPTYREIAAKFSDNIGTVQVTVAGLLRKGYIKKSPGVARGFRISDSSDSGRQHPEMNAVPLFGRVAAGEPVFADSNIQDYLPFPVLKSADEDVFCLRVIGDSMIEKGIYENDIVFVRKQNTADDGNIVIALLENEATVKIFKRDRSGIYLKPANRMYPNITRPFMILGKVISLKRDYTAF